MKKNVFALALSCIMLLGITSATAASDTSEFDLSKIQEIDGAAIDCTQDAMGNEICTIVTKQGSRAEVLVNEVLANVPIAAAQEQTILRAPDTKTVEETFTVKVMKNQTIYETYSVTVHGASSFVYKQATADYLTWNGGYLHDLTVGDEKNTADNEIDFVVYESGGLLAQVRFTVGFNGGVTSRVIRNASVAS